MRYSFVVPIYNDAALATPFCAEFERVMRVYLGSLPLRDSVELIFVDDGSPSPTSDATLDAAAREFDFVRVITLSRNFGQHIALSAGYAHATGDYVGMLNVDMEDPPSEIPLLLNEILKGDAGIVYGIRSVRQSPWHTNWTSLVFNWTLSKLTGYDMPLNTATLRVMSRPFVDAYNQLSERARYIPGLEMWLGFRKSYVNIAHQRRTSGRSAYTLLSRLRLAFEAIISFSDLPLRIMVMLGTLVACLGFLLTAVLVLGKLFFIRFQPGYTSTIAIVLALGGAQILAIGLASLYIGRILREVQNRPLYIVRRRLNVHLPNESRD